MTEVLETKASLSERLGERATVDAAVGAFYFNVLNDERVARFFSGVDMRTLIDHQKHFLEFAFDGTHGYTGRPLRAAHQRLVEEHGLTRAHFDVMVEILRRTLADLDLPRQLIEEVASVAASVRQDVLGL